MKKSFFEENSSESLFFDKIQGEISHFLRKTSWKTWFFCLKNASKKESCESLTKVWRKFHWNCRWPCESFSETFGETFAGHTKVSWNFHWNFRQTFVKLSHDSFFDAFFRQKKSCFSAVFSQKNEKFHLGFYQKKGFRLNFLQKMTFSLICPNDVFFFTETFFSQKLTNLSEISHVIPCYSLLCFFVCFQRIAFPPVRFK